MKEKNSPGRGAGLDHAIAAIDQRERDREAGRAPPSAGSSGWRPAPSCWLRVSTAATLASKRARIASSSVKALTMRMPCTRLLQGLEHARAAGELACARPCVMRLDQLAQDQHRRRHDDEAEQRHHRILHHHHGEQADQREQIAADRGDQQVEHLARGGGAGRQPRDEFGANAASAKKPRFCCSSRSNSVRWLSAMMLVADARQDARDWP